MSRPIATTALAIALLACEGAPVTPPSSSTTPPRTVVTTSSEGSTRLTETEQYRQYREKTGYPYSQQQYARLPQHQRCGTACGQPPTSGEQQLRYLCDRGLIATARC